MSASPPRSQREHRERFVIPAIAGVLYFSEGLPFGIVNELLPLYLRVHHASLTTIGLATTITFAWTAKVFWSPLIDAFGTYRQWIGAALLGIALSLGGLAVSPIGWPFWLFLIILALASSTQDLAVDAFTIRITPPNLLGPVNSLRVMAYRGALMASGGLAAIAGIAGWPTAFGTAGAVAFAICLFTFRLRADHGERRTHHNLLADLKQWLQRRDALLLLVVVLLYRLGEFAIVTMIKPYWIDRGYSVEEIGVVTSTIGIGVSIAGAIIGGMVVSRLGVYRALLWLGIAQIVSNLGYAVVASSNAGRASIYIAAVAENLGYGLGTAAFLAFLMSICDRERAATEYAILTAVYGLSRTMIGGASGAIAQYAGYPAYFWLTVFLGIPALLLLPRIKDSIAHEPSLSPAS